MGFKNFLRSTLNFLHLDLTKNLEYDRLTKLILKRVIQRDSNCIDIGCHKGEILQILLKAAPQGQHFAFEPIPYFYTDLLQNFGNKATIYPYALSDEAGNSTFQLVKNAPAYSGIKKRRYDIENPEIEEIQVELKTLDELIPQETKIDFIKIDVEGGEFGVLKGAKNLIKTQRPTIIFECGKGGSDYYGTRPQEVFKYLTEEMDLKVFTLKNFIKQQQALTQNDFIHAFESGSDYYFIADK